MKRFGWAALVAVIATASSATETAPQGAGLGVEALPETRVAVMPPLAPAAQDLRDMLAAGGDDLAPLDAIYALHGYAPIWDLMKTAALLGAIDAAPGHGLPAERYDLSALRALPPKPGADYAAREVALSQAFLRYARDLNSGVLEPRRVDRDIVVSPKRPDPGALLEGMAETPDPIGYLAALAPAHRHYTDLLAEKTRLEALIAAGGWGAPVPGGRSLKPGDSGDRVVSLRQRLGVMQGADYGDAPEFDSALEAAVQKAQVSFGLNDDGVVGPKTLEAINVAPQTRLQQVLVNLERQRWLNYDRGARHIYVNQADFSVQVIDNGETTLWSRVVIGKNGHRTQEFNDEMTYMVVNPTWHVPRSIATEEMLPKLKGNPGALGRSMQIMTRNGTQVNPALIDFSQFTTRNFPFIIKQRPGGGNALGRVKFMFPNEFNIYLHDTPSKSLFGRDVRAYSHGCVRVQKPFELAHVLLGAQSDDPKASFQGYLDGGAERYVNLDAPVPVYLTYQSAWVDRFGEPQYRADIYGRDARVFDALRAAGVTTVAVDG
ncbi:MAG: L,D-transpeptidase family protein [Pseudomonadota bacterium]